jgi:hypothetical protein
MNYYGLTTQSVRERKNKHKTIKNHMCASYLIIESCDDWDIEIVEVCPIGTTKEQALWRERYWFENNECVNKQRPIISKEERRENNRLRMLQKAREKGTPIKRKGLDMENYKAYQAKINEKKREERRQKKELLSQPTV